MTTALKLLTLHLAKDSGLGKLLVSSEQSLGPCEAWPGGVPPWGLRPRQMDYSLKVATITMALGASEHGRLTEEPVRVKPGQGRSAALAGTVTAELKGEWQHSIRTPVKAVGNHTDFLLLRQHLNTGVL